MTSLTDKNVLVSTDWAAEHLDDDELQFVEVDVDTDSYDSGHIPGAVGWNWKKQLQDQLRRDIASQEEFEKLLGDSGIGNDTRIVLYGDNNNWFAAWAYWLLKYYGHEDVVILDGGRKKWVAENRELTTDQPGVAQKNYAVETLNKQYRAFRDDIAPKLNNDSFGLVDVRSPEEFKGEILAPEGTKELCQRAGPQVYRGLGGLFIIEDEEEQALNLPSGDYELPLIVQDKRFNDSGQMTYNLNMMARRMGFFGNTMLVNSMQAPYHEVATRFYRLRLLNGSNARMLDFSFSDNSSFYVIGSDGGLHDRPYEISSITLTPGERADLLVDFGNYSVGEKVRMTAETRNGMGGMMDGEGGCRMDCEDNRMRGRENRSWMSRNEGGSHNGGGDFLEFRITKEEKDPFRLPQTLTELSFPDEADAERSRRINLTMEMMRGPAIDGKFFEMLRADQTVQQGTLEVWEFNNRTGMPHPMHLHATQFKVLDRSRGPLAPHERGWKDTVRVERRETVRVLTKFDAEKGLYAFHCHNLEHEDNGMMANFEIV